jgi:hypothetical protein
LAAASLRASSAALVAEKLSGAGTRGIAGIFGIWGVLNRHIAIPCPIPQREILAALAVSGQIAAISPAYSFKKFARLLVRGERPRFHSPRSSVKHGRLKLFRDEPEHGRKALADPVRSPRPSDPIPGANLTATERGFRIAVQFDDVSEIP